VINELMKENMTIAFCINLRKEVLSDCICRHCRLVTVLVLDLIHPRVENGVVMRGANWQSIRISELRVSRLVTRATAGSAPSPLGSASSMLRYVSFKTSGVNSSSASFDIVIADNIAELFLKVFVELRKFCPVF